MGDESRGASLEAEYSPRLGTPDFLERQQRRKEMSARARETFPVKEISYGESPAEVFDVYLSSAEHAPTVVFFHGGYWRSSDKAFYGYLANAFVPRNVNFISVNYGLCPNVSMGALLDQCSRALGKVYELTGNVSGRTREFVLTGHSAGAHIVAMMLSGHGKLPVSDVKGAVLISGVFDLEPLLETSINNDLRLTKTEARRLSPMHLAMDARCPVIVAVGELESEQFKWQSRSYERNLSGMGLASSYLEVPHKDHYSIMGPEDWCDGLFVKEILKWLQ